ncbi:MAG: hypothetical protein WAL03_00295, partial [Pseudolabrys sp.]
MLRVSCSKRHRNGCYRLNRLIERRDRDAELVDFLDEIAGDCPKRAAVNWNDRCLAFSLWHAALVFSFVAALAFSFEARASAAPPRT